MVEREGKGEYEYDRVKHCKEDEGYAHREFVFKYVLGLLDQLDEPEVLSQELPVIPKYVADWIKKAKRYHSISWLLNYENIKNWSHELTLWCFESGNDDNLHKLARAWLYGYEMEEEPLYYALIKGHELIDDGGMFWNFDMCDEKVIISPLNSPRDSFLTKMSKSQWNELGINESNADFVRVEEME